MPSWSLEKVKQLKASPVKERLLKELKSGRGSPVTGSLNYWAQIDQSKSTDFSKEPHKYRVGKGEQGVLSTHPYTSDISAYWRFKTEEDALISADAIYCMFETYLAKKDFVGADVALKFLMMGFTRARRYANYPSGRKYDKHGNFVAQAPDALKSEKAHASQVFKLYWDAARTNADYKLLKTNFSRREAGLLGLFNHKIRKP